MNTVFESVALLVPFVWVFALPMGLLTAMLLVFGRFSADHELTAARASGISLLALITPVLLLSLLCCGLSAWINMELGPQCRVASLKLLERVRGELMMNTRLPAGQFIRDIDPRYIFYTGKNHDGDLQDVMVFVLEKRDERHDDGPRAARAGWRWTRSTSSLSCICSTRAASPPAKTCTSAPRRTRSTPFPSSPSRKNTSGRASTT